MEEAFQEFSAVTTDGNSSGESNEQLTSMVDRKSFVRNVLLVLRLALEGAPAMLLSARALRNIALQRTQGDQDQAAAHVVEAENKHHIEDDETLVSVCLAAVGLPTQLAKPLWHRLRHIGQVCELLGHDALLNRGRVLCAAVGIITRSEPIEMAAAHAVWFRLCANAMATTQPPEELAKRLDASEGTHLTDAALMFLEKRQVVPRADWSDPVEPVTLARAKLIAQQLLTDPERAARAAARAGIASATEEAAADDAAHDEEQGREMLV